MITTNQFIGIVLVFMFSQKLNMKNDSNTSSTKTASSNSLSVKEQLRAMADNAPVMIWISDLDKGSYYFNNGWLNFTGRTTEEESGNSWRENIHPDDLQRWITTYTNHFERQEAFKIEYRLRRRNGDYRWVLDHAVPRYDAQGKFEGFIGSCVDISDIKELEDRRNSFISAVSHEIKTPLTTMKVYIQILEDVLKTKNDEQLTELVSHISKQANRFTDLVRNLLDISKTEEDFSSYKKTAVQLGDIVEEAFEEFKKNYADAKMDLKGYLDAKVFGDKERLSVAVKNILHNAIKYAEPREIIISVSKEGGKAKVSVSNPGSVIPAESSKKVFEKFYRVPDKKNKTFPGIGVGLYLTSEIIKNHEGEIWVESDTEKGTTICFTLPIIQ